MTIHDYLEENILLLTASPIVEHFQIITRRETESDGYLRVRAIPIGEGLLEVSIYCQMSENAVRLVDYRFHWQDSEGKLIKRWDNARHHPELTTFPYHIHVASDAIVKESANVDLSEVLQELELEAGEV